MTRFHLAQCNVARLLEPLDSPRLADFVAALDPINELADGAPGFVWRFSEDTAVADSAVFDDDLLIVNMSVWETAEALAAFVYRSDHVGVMRRRRERFERIESYLVLWWIPAGTVPTVHEARRRLDLLRRIGPTAEAFTFRSPFPIPAMLSA
jgi:hypothetical protein